MKNNLKSFNAMKKKLFFISCTLLLSIDSYSQSASPVIEWAVGFEGASSTVTAADNQGNLYVTGYFLNYAVFNDITLTSEGLYDIFVAKLNAQGQIVWVKQAGGTSLDTSNGISVDEQGNCYISGKFMDTVAFGNTQLTGGGGYVAKLSPQGEFVWAIKAGSQGSKIIVDEQGVLYVTGTFSGTINFGGSVLSSLGTSDIFISKLNSQGQFLWTTQAECSSDIYPSGSNGIALDDLGHIYVTGGFTDTAFFGNTVLVSAGNYNPFIAKLDSQGQFIWAVSVASSSPGGDSGSDISTDAFGNCYATGSFGASTVFGDTTLVATKITGYIAKLNPQGQFLWAKKVEFPEVYNSPADPGSMVISIDTYGNNYAAGRFGATATFGDTTLTSTGKDDVFITKFDSQGSFLWAIKGGGKEYDGGHGVTLGEEGTFYVTGNFQDTATFNDFTLVSTNNTNAFVLKINENTLNIEKTEKTSFKVFPNPAESVVYIQSETAFSVVDLKDLNGKLIYTQNVQDKQASIDISKLSAGVYVVEVSSETAKHIERVVKY